MIKNGEILTFEPEKHHYFNEKGERLLSVTQLIHALTPPFDPDGSILINKAEKEGVTPEELQKKWTEEKDKSCVTGTLIHKLIEDYIAGRPILPDHEYAWVIEEFKKLPFKGKLQTEILLSNSKYGIAGTLDLPELFEDGTVNIWDYKTNKRIDKFSIYGNRMLPPISHLFSTNFMHYTLQLNVYAFMLEELGYWVKNLNLIYVNRKKKAFEVMPIAFRPADTKKILPLARKVLSEQENH